MPCIDTKVPERVSSYDLTKPTVKKKKKRKKTERITPQNKSDFKDIGKFSKFMSVINFLGNLERLPSFFILEFINIVMKYTSGIPHLSVLCLPAHMCRVRPFDISDTTMQIMS